MEKIVFNKTGYDPFIDFIKAYAIICVLLGHTFPYTHETGYYLWYGMQVPLFILVQTFHVFKKDVYHLNLKKTISRILLPFLFVQAIPICASLVLDRHIDVKNMLIWGAMVLDHTIHGCIFKWQ